MKTLLRLFGITPKAKSRLRPAVAPKRKALVRRANGQIARKIPVNYMGKTEYYIYL